MFSWSFEGSEHAGVLRALDVLVELREADRVPGGLPGHGVAGLDAARHALERRRGLGLEGRRRGGRRGRHEAAAGAMSASQTATRAIFPRRFF